MTALTSTTFMQQMPADLTEQQKERWIKSREEALKRKAEAEKRRLQQEEQQRRGLEQQPAHRPATAFIAQHQYNKLQKQSIASNQLSRPSQPRPNPILNNANRPSCPTGSKNLSTNQQIYNIKTSSHQPLPTRPVLPPVIGSKNAPILDVFFNITLLDEERIKLTFQPFRDFIRDKIKEIPSRIYDYADRSWSFALKDYELLKRKIYELRQHKINIKLDEIPIGVRSNLFLDIISPMNSLASSSANDSELLNKVDTRIRDILFPFQRRGVIFGIQRNGRLLIADEMGLGKTVQAIAIASAYRVEWPLLIVCPSSVKYMWSRQIFHFLPDTRPCVVEKARDLLPASRATNVVIIMSYDLMAMRIDELKRQTYYVIIFDECHMLKEAKANRTRAADELAKRAHRVMLLSGTPAMSRPIELYTQIKMIDPKIFPKYKEYAIRYCDGHQGKFCFDTKGQSNPVELKAVMNKIMIRRLKKDVLDDLPAKRREIIYLSGDIIDKKLKELKKAKEDLHRNDRLSDDKRVKTQSFMEYYVLTGQAKMETVAQHIIDTYFYEDAPEKKILIFAHHLPVLDRIGHFLAKNGVQFIRIDGATNAKDRQTYCEQFQTSSKTRAAVLSITAAGTGITLTAASVVIFAELYWNPSLLIQAEDRAHRVGQHDSVHVQYMLARGTADMEIWDMVSSKLQVLGNVNLANESYGDAQKSTKLCVDRNEQHLITDFYSLLNQMDEEEDMKENDLKKENGTTIDVRLGKEEYEGKNDEEEPIQKRSRNSEE